MRVRNIIERVFPVAIKCWGILGGQALHYSYFEQIPAYADIASALHNKFRVCIDEKKGNMDEKDFNTMKIRIGRKNEITSRFLKQNSHTKRWKLRTCTLKRFSPESEKKRCPRSPN